MLGERVRRFADLLLASFPNYDLRGTEMYRKWKASTAHCATPLQPRSARSGRGFSSALSPVPKCQNGEDHRIHEERDNQDGGALIGSYVRKMVLSGRKLRRRSFRN